MIRPTAWLKRTTIPDGVGLNSLLNLSEAALLLGVDRRTLQRAIRRGDGPCPTEGYVGRQVWFLVADLIRWRIGVAGPEPEEGRVNFPKVGTRPIPIERPAWWQHGERRYVALRRIRTGFKAELARLEFRMMQASLDERIRACGL